MITVCPLLLARPIIRELALPGLVSLIESKHISHVGERVLLFERFLVHEVGPAFSLSDLVLRLHTLTYGDLGTVSHLERHPL